MISVVVSAHNVVNFPEGGGHLWAYLQYVRGLQQAGCEVWWLERFRWTDDGAADRQRLREFTRRMEPFGLANRLILYSVDPADGAAEHPRYLTMSDDRAQEVFRRADLLLNFCYAIEPALLEPFARTAMVDIDPGLLQVWMSTGQLAVADHDVYFTTGETVGTPAARFSDCGLRWVHVPRPVSLEDWPWSREPGRNEFTTVSSWWADEWVDDGSEMYENNKRVTFLELADLPRLSGQALELAAYLGPGDRDDVRQLRAGGWRVRHVLDVASTPASYRRYVQASRGEFSCAKPSCQKLQNAWISDRTLCYLASGRPAVVQDTGPTAYLRSGEGALRFSGLEDAISALAEVTSHYQYHSRAARELAAAHFDARKVAQQLLEVALNRGPAGAHAAAALKPKPT
ncbi:MAG: hypothetical protein M3P44_13360 [Actinomycetota bacterium]|nr:hypothetical protein [Actinomycetota bacterium]